MSKIQLICGNHGMIVENFTSTMVFLQTCLFFYIYGAQGQELCIIVSPNIVFILYQEHAFFNPTPMLRNFGLVVKKSYLWPISQVITKLECIRDETINNLTTRGWFVQVRSKMLAQLKKTKMIKFLPKGSLCFRGMNIMKVVNLLVIMKTLWQVCLILKTCAKEKLCQ